MSEARTVVGRPFGERSRQRAEQQERRVLRVEPVGGWFPERARDEAHGQVVERAHADPPACDAAESLLEHVRRQDENRAFVTAVRGMGGAVLLVETEHERRVRVDDDGLSSCLNDEDPAARKRDLRNRRQLKSARARSGSPADDVVDLDERARNQARRLALRHAHIERLRASPGSPGRLRGSALEEPVVAGEVLTHRPDLHHLAVQEMEDLTDPIFEGLAVIVATPADGRERDHVVI